MFNYTTFCLPNHDTGEIYKFITDTEVLGIKPFYMVSNIGRVFNYLTATFLVEEPKREGVSWTFEVEHVDGHTSTVDLDTLMKNMFTDKDSYEDIDHYIPEVKPYARLYRMIYFPVNQDISVNDSFVNAIPVTNKTADSIAASLTNAANGSIASVDTLLASQIAEVNNTIDIPVGYGYVFYDKDIDLSVSQVTDYVFEICKHIGI